MSSVVTCDEVLTPAEEAERRTLEDKALQSLRQVGQGLTDFAQAVTEIRERRLYRPLTWEEYCQSVFGRCGETLNRIIRHGQNLKSLEDFREMGFCAIMPQLESQTRPLDRLPPAQKAAAWELATQSGARQPTQVEVKSAAEIAQLQPGDGVMLWVPPEHCLPEEVWSCLEVEEINGVPTSAKISMGGAPIRVPYSNIRGVIPSLISLLEADTPGDGNVAESSAVELPDTVEVAEKTLVIRERASSPEVLFTKRLVRIYSTAYTQLLAEVDAMRRLGNEGLAPLVDDAIFASDQIHQHLQKLQWSKNARD